jgi:hypothetical protein
LARGRKSQQRNNFGSFSQYKRRAERADAIPGFDPAQSKSKPQQQSTPSIRFETYLFGWRPVKDLPE